MLLGTGGVALTQTDLLDDIASATTLVDETTEEVLSNYDNLRLNGLAYPERLMYALTEDQQTAIIAFIDEVNATYDFANMTDDEIDAALITINADFYTLLAELQVNILDGSVRKVRVAPFTLIRENGFLLPDVIYEDLDESQVLALTEFIDTVNATYDFANMTDEEIKLALDEIHSNLNDLLSSLGIELPVRDFDHPHDHHRPHRDHVDPSLPDVDESEDTTDSTSESTETSTV